MSEDQTQYGEREFKNLHEVSGWLDEQGWKVARATLYKHAKDGRLRPNENGVFLEKQVEKYAIQWLRKKTDAEKVKAEKLAEEERKEKIRYQTVLRKKEEMKYSILGGKYILRDQLYLELASRAAVLDTGIKAVVQVRAEEWVAACGGDQSRIAEFIRSVLSDMEDLVNSFSTTRQFQVVFKGEEQQAEDRMLKEEVEEETGFRPRPE